MPTSPIPCEDNVVQQMDLKNNVAPGLITDVADGNGYWSTIDARAGGFMYTDSYVYAKFTDKGLQKVDLTDEQSIGSMDWDIAFRRFVIRINSGNSGPSCVMAVGSICQQARMPTISTRSRNGRGKSSTSDGSFERSTSPGVPRTLGALGLA